MSRTLAEAAQGVSVRITRMLPGGGAIRQRLLDMGVTKGTSLVVERRAPLGDPIEVLVKGYHLAIRRNEAALIEVDCE
ncbi:MAG: ferrous iron transport protein A [Lentisphaeria bacterium]|nr:ferrous iron transport protein A [Lentisphaeria bacterium]